MSPLLLELGPASLDDDVLLTRSHCIAAGCEVVAVKPEHVQYCLDGSVVGVEMARRKSLQTLLSALERPPRSLSCCT